MKSRGASQVAVFIILFLSASAGWTEENALLSDSAALSRSVVSMGNPARLQRAFAKARRGEKVTVGVLGGSITQGAMASKPENRYGDRIAQWWRDTFPQAQIEYVNAGIGATGSDIGAFRVGDHLLTKKPDFVVVEYAVNDLNAPAFAETLEGVVRQILESRNRPAVMLLFMMNNKGMNAQEQHAPIGAHYGLPMVSFRDALWPEIEAGTIAWSDVEADEV
ncbi:MAG: SGNH/GDSL hydrolase family protein, partial [Candidatus Hydrogenedentes bacterium]|nr:SGNH/GDSL hydrolase family protein [Candidatus Hydrogenedentota bacterium]